MTETLGWDLPSDSNHLDTASAVHRENARQVCLWQQVVQLIVRTGNDPTGLCLQTDVSCA
jgi:hypothetical protein